MKPLSRTCDNAISPGTRGGRGSTNLRPRATLRPAQAYLGVTQTDLRRWIPAPSPSVKGTGLGLFVVRSVIKRHEAKCSRAGPAAGMLPCSSLLRRAGLVVEDEHLASLRFTCRRAPRRGMIPVKLIVADGQ